MAGIPQNTQKALFPLWPSTKIKYIRNKVVSSENSIVIILIIVTILTKIKIITITEIIVIMIVAKWQQ